MIKMVPVKYEQVALGGGLDQITPTLQMAPGVCRDARNFECLEFGGYGRVDGYERYSGQPAPSSASYFMLYVDAFANTPAVGQTITNQLAVPTGYVIALGANYVVCTKGVGTFNIGDSLKVGATVIGNLVMAPSAISGLLSAQYTNLAAAAYRTDIVAPPGSGPIRGGFIYNDLVYCFRDNAGNTASNIWKESAAGWVQIALFNEISFTAGAVAIPADGATLTQGGVTATVKRVVLQTGVWTGSGAGRLIITNPAGGNFAAGAATLTGGATLTLSGVQTAIVIQPGGRGEYDHANFFGQLSAARIYYVDGVNRMAEFDGTVYVPLTTNTVPDKPKHVAAFKNHLFFSVQSSIFNSAIGNPYSYATIGGAAELACGDTISNLQVQPGAQTVGTMSVFARNTTYMLYGTSSANWNLVVYNVGTGALDYTSQNLSQNYTMDDRGVYALTATLNYGNFDQASMTNLQRPFIAERRTKVSASALARDKSQYRIFFTDGTGLYITIVNDKNMGAMPVQFPTYVNCSWEGTLSSGALVKFFGGGDGQVHRLDIGTSFDGAAINAYIQLNWASVNSPRVLKRYRRASLEVSGKSYAALDFGYALGYGTADIQQSSTVNYATPFSPTFWDSFTWDLFTWDGRTLFPTECEMSGTGENVQFTIASNSTDFAAFAVNSLIFHYSFRRGLR